MIYITTTAQLEDFCASIATTDYVTVDTEFMRETTYYADLCLIQVGGPDKTALIDPLAEGIDLTPFYKILLDPKVVKVFHASRQDLEIFYQRMNGLPQNVFDTQVAAMVLGFGESVGFEALVNQVLKKKVDKSSRFSDWSKRPLRKEQIAYAVDDVLLLRPIYDFMRQKLKDREPWLQAEMSKLLDEKTYINEPYEAWRRIKIRGRGPKFLNIIRELTAWRERKARERNVPRGRILKDDAILEIAALVPSSPSDLSQGRALPRNFSESSFAQEVVDVVQEAKLHDFIIEDKNTNEKRLTDKEEALIELLKVLLRANCRRSNVVPKMVASTDDLEAFARGKREVLFLEDGWRFEMFGKDALELFEGNLAIGFDKKGLKMVKLS